MNVRQIERLHACLALQDKILERLMVSEMKLKVLESQMFILWNKLSRRPRGSGCRALPAGQRHRPRGRESVGSTFSECTSQSP